MSPLRIDISSLLEDCQTRLLEAEPTVVPYADKIALENNNFPPSLGSGHINVYALWVRSKSDEAWQVMYIGQRSFKQGWKRVAQHLFWTPDGTQSKLEQVRAVISSGSDIAVTAILVEPDSMRLSVEEELIARNSLSKTHLAWNQKARAKKPASKRKSRYAV